MALMAMSAYASLCPWVSIPHWCLQLDGVGLLGKLYSSKLSDMYAYLHVCLYSLATYQKCFELDLFCNDN